MARCFPAVVVFQSAFIFVSGGSSPIDFTKEFASCCYYDVGKDEWNQAPEMNFARKNHSMCAFGKYIYAFSGVNNSGWLDSIERLDASAITNERKATWEIVRLETGNVLPARGVPMVAPFGADEILYMGGLLNG